MIKLVTPPVDEPVSGPDVALFLRLDSDDYNDRLQQFATSARIAAENYTRRAFITQTWVQSLDIQQIQDKITIPRPPLQQIDNITFYNTKDAAVLQDPTQYNVDLTSDPSTIFLKIGYAWAMGIALRNYNSMEITFDAGYGDLASDVPQEIRDCIIEAAAYYFTQGSTGVLPPDVITKLQQYRIYL
jgi:uncharacterized phiE125 gp8 family phage protein